MQGTVLKRPAGRMRGFSLVEVLVSIIMLSFGLLGMVGLQAAALKANYEARLQSAAFGLAQELAEMMRGNKDIGIWDDASNPYLLNASSPLSPATASYCMAVGSSSGCTGVTKVDQTQIAQAQMTEWLARVDAELPGARITVCFDTTPYDSGGLPKWACTAATGSTKAQPYIKIGWTQSSTNRAAAAASALIRTSSADSRPSLVFAVIAGSAT